MADENKDEYVGVVYILTNPSFPKYVKIGYADNLAKRLKELNRSECIPFAFQPYAYYETKDRLSDIAVHDMIDRINPNLRAIDTFNGKKRKKEFFEMSPEDAYYVLESIARFSGTASSLHLVQKGEDITKSTHTKKGKVTKSAETHEPRKSPAERFSFSKCGILPGSQLVCAMDHNIVATVVDEYNISYEGKIYTTSGLLEKLFNKNAIQGPKYWMYNGELLVDIRARLENEGLYK